MKRRQFIRITSAGVGAALAPSLAAAAAAKRPDLVGLDPVQGLPGDQTRSWLGESYWANRLQDWRLHDGKIECLCGQADFEVRTFSLLTRSLGNSHQAGRIRAKVGMLEPGKEGYCGFLLGVGSGELDYRGWALAQRASGTGGGFMAVIDHEGELSFRDFSDASETLKFEKITRKKAAGIREGGIGSREILLDCHIDPVDGGLFDVRLVASDARTGDEFGFVVRTGVAASDLTGGVLLLSSPPSGEEGTRWWFSDIATGGDKIGVHPERKLGPVMGCLYSLNRNVLKLTAQFLPVSLEHDGEAQLEFRRAGSEEWLAGPTARIGDGFMAAFRVEDWDFRNDHDYRVVYPGSEIAPLFSGTIVKDPGDDRTLKIALFSCLITTAKGLDDVDYKRQIPQERLLGRYSPDNILFPHSELVNNCDSHDPDLYLFVGDQYYEGYPTRHARHTPEAKLDTLYRWYLWYWAFRDSIRNRPAIVIADDHDILQGNLWGEGGKTNTTGTEEDGGYVWDKDVVRMVYRIQHGHNPDAYDPTPIENDIPVTYGAFEYGGVSFAVLEDRKFKTHPDYESDPLETKGEMLGKRQETFLEAWADMHPGLPKIVITGTMWGSPQTDENLKPLLDYDANGYPPDGRRRALRLVRDGGCNLVLAGDQHLGLVARQGVDDYEDGPVCFAGPGAAAFWQRWFEGAGRLENQRNGDPNTGNFTDTFGNKMRVLAVANPKVTHREYEDGNTVWGKFLADRKLKSEGYCVVRVDHAARQHVLECWEWNSNPRTDGQFAGWPYALGFDELTG